MGWGLLFFVLLGVALGAFVLQATYAAQAWRTAIAAGDLDVLRQAVGNAMEAWRRQKPPRTMAPADWQALSSAATIAMDQQRCRVSMVATSDIRVINNERREMGRPIDVARRVAVKMVERALYEIPHVRFDEVQVDVYAAHLMPDGSTATECILVVRANREDAANAPWDTAEDPEILEGWRTREAAPGEPLDPEFDALIAPDAQAAVAAAEETLRRASR
ncbi:MAG: hypothetical protein U0360_06270 [Dehalococcoidia bacterium]